MLPTPTDFTPKRLEENHARHHAPNTSERFTIQSLFSIMHDVYDFNFQIKRN